MIYPKLKEPDTSRKTVDVFRGYNHNLRIADGEFFEMENLTSDGYPVLCPRGKRGSYTSDIAVTGMIAKDALCYCSGTEFVINGYPVELGLSDEPKQMISMGAYVIILPDRKYINTVDLTDFGSIDAVFTTGSAVSFSLCRVDGTEYLPEYIQPQEPEAPENLAYWLDTSSSPHALKQWSQSAGMWVSITSTYIRISSAGIGKAFGQYDGVRLSGLTEPLYDANTQLELDDGSELAALEGAAVVWERGDDFIVVAGILSTSRSITNPVTVARQMPWMDFVVESENRLWGCRYGIAADGSVVNEVYASKLGDFKNWNCFMGLSTDSYAASVGTDGVFTGAVTLPGQVLFFKENCIHKVWGNYPANFQIQTTVCRGVQKGCEKSLAVVGEVIYYKARHGVCAYDGSLPVDVSYALGDVRYSKAVAGTHGSKYYISMEDTDGAWHLFCYDTVKQLWHRQDNLRVERFCDCGEELYAHPYGENRIITMLGSGEADTAPVRWMAQTGAIGTDMPDRKVISRLIIRMAMDVGAKCTFSVRYDSCGAWVHLGTLVGTSLRSFSVPVRPRRCDHMHLRMEGQGNVRIYSITKVMEQGSDLP